MRDRKKYMKAWRAANPDKERANHRAWYDKNRDAELERSKEHFGKTAFAPNHHKRWTVDELQTVADAGVEVTDTELAKQLGRSEMSVIHARIRLRKAGIVMGRKPKATIKEEE